MRMQVVTQLSAKVRQFAPCLFASAIGIAATLTAVGLTASHETQIAERQFDVLAENHFMILQNGINEYVNRLNAVRATAMLRLGKIRPNQRSPRLVETTAA